MVPELRLIDPAPESASVTKFTDAMSALASGIVLVTCRVDNRPWGVTVTAFASVSADPPTVLVSLGSETAGARAIAATRRFGVSILTEDHLAIACLGSTRGTPKFLESLAESERRSASPVVAGALAQLDCAVSEAVQIADHTVFFGRVREARASLDGTPLVYFQRAYRTLTAQIREHASPGKAVRCLSS